MKKALKTAPRGTAFNYAGQRWSCWNITPPAPSA